MGTGPPADGGPLAFVADLERPVLDAGDHHHLARVVRLRAGDPLSVSDGAGAWRSARFAGADPAAPLEVVGEVVITPAPEPPITVAFALVKGERPEWAVQKLTEVGVDVIWPFLAARSVVRWDERKRATGTERLRRVAREACMQSRRCRWPEVRAPVSFAEVVAAAGSGAARADRDGAPPSLAHPVLLVGPEGGWDDHERSVPLPTVGLGDHVLRAETAAIAGGTLLTALRAGLVAGA